MNYKLKLEDIEIHAFHGCFDEEKIVGGKFLITIDLEANLEKVCLTDNINDTINYQKIFNNVKKEMLITSNTIEHVAKRIYNTLKNKYPQITKLKVKLSKINPSLGGQLDKVSILIY